MDQLVDGAMSAGTIERSIADLLTVVQTCGWFIKQKLSRSCICSLSRRPARLLALHHLSCLALKSPAIIDLGSLVRVVVMSRSPSTLYRLCSSSGLLLTQIRVDKISVPSPKSTWSASSEGMVCLTNVTKPCPPSSIVLW